MQCLSFSSFDKHCLPLKQRNGKMVSFAQTYISSLSDVLSDNGRLARTGDVITAFGKMMSAHRKEVICSVTTAQVWNGRIDTSSLNFLLFETGSLIRSVISVDVLYNQPMTVSSFQPLDEANLSDLKVALNGFLQKGETIKLETKVPF